MASIVRYVFNPKNWSRNKSLMFGTLKPVMGTVKAKPLLSWKGFKSFVSRNSNFFTAVGTGTATYLVTKGISSLITAAESTNERKRKKYGTSDPAEYTPQETRSHMKKLAGLFDNLAYMDPDSNAFREKIVVAVAVYNDMLVSLPTDSSSFALSANSFYGSMYRLGIQPEADADDSQIVNMIALIKDNFVNESELSNDLKNLILVDSYNVPLKSA